MTKILLSAAAALAIGLPAAAHAQQANILIVDSDRIMSDCTACKSAASQLQTKQAALRSRAQTLQTQLQTEGKALQTAIDALNGKEPDAALKAKITAISPHFPREPCPSFESWQDCCSSRMGRPSSSPSRRRSGCR